MEKYHPSLQLKDFQNYYKAIPIQMGRFAGNILV